MSKFLVIKWFEAVRGNPELINQAIDYYNQALDAAIPHITAIGHLQTLVAETPGLEFNFKTILTDAQQLRKWFENEYENLKSEKYKAYLIDDDLVQKFGKLKTTEIGNIVKADDELIELSNYIRLLAYAEHSLQDVADGFVSRSIMLNKITDIRIKGLEEVFINPYNESVNA